MPFTLTPIVLFQLFQLLAVGYMVGDILEGSFVKLERQRNSIIIFMIITVFVLFGGIYLGTTHKNILEQVRPYIYEAIAVLIGLVIGLYKERVRGRR
jgi:hypothetical protein